MLKRIKSIETDFRITVLYWDRVQEIKETFEINPNHSVKKILLKAPMGQPIKRIIPWIRFLLNHSGF